jgi:hypothetical protein
LQSCASTDIRTSTSLRTLRASSEPAVLIP